MNSTQASDTLPDRLPDNPMHIADAWLGEATEKSVRRNPNAMMLATVGTDGQPSARIVLCKAFVPDPGYLVVHTNYHSRKGRELEANPRVAVVFHWDALGRQVRIEGVVVRSPEAESDSYFATRDPGSRLGAWGSDQSQPIGSRDALIRQIGERAAVLGVTAEGEPVGDRGATIRRPPHWGGLRIWAMAIELWLEGRARVHDRAVWRRQIVKADDHSFSVSSWSGTRLQP